MKINLKSIFILIGVWLVLIMKPGLVFGQEERSLKLYYFWADNCKQCSLISPAVSKSAADYGIYLSKVNVHSNPDLAKKYCVQGLPSLVLTSSGKYINRHDGFDEEKGIKKFLSRSLSMPASGLDCSKNLGVVEESQPREEDRDLPVDTSNEEKENTAKLPLVGVVLVLGGGLVVAKKLLSNKRSSLKKKSGGLVASPADGKMVSWKQANYEQGLLDQGYVYNPQKDGFDYVPEKVRQTKKKASSLSKQVKEMRRRRKNKKTDLGEIIDKIHEERKENIRGDMEFQQKMYKHHMRRAKDMDTLSKVASNIEAVADVGVEALSEVTGPAGKVVKRFYDGAKDINTATNEVIDHGKRKGGLIGGAKVLFARLRSRIIGKGMSRFGPARDGFELLAKASGGKVIDEVTKQTGEEAVKKAFKKR